MTGPTIPVPHIVGYVESNGDCSIYAIVFCATTGAAQLAKLSGPFIWHPVGDERETLVATAALAKVQVAIAQEAAARVLIPDEVRDAVAKMLSERFKDNPNVKKES